MSKLYRARSLLYRRQILQVNIRKHNHSMQNKQNKHKIQSKHNKQNKQSKHKKGAHFCADTKSRRCEKISRCKSKIKMKNSKNLQWQSDVGRRGRGGGGQQTGRCSRSCLSCEDDRCLRCLAITPCVNPGYAFFQPRR